jgi:hypothetical protein
MKLKYLLILLLSWFNAFSQSNTEIIFEENHADSIDKKIDSILLIGVGTSTTRIFLDDLSQHIMKDLYDDEVVTKYYYLGKTITEAQSEYDTINKNGFKAILFFLPKGASFFDVQGKLNRTTSNSKIGPITTTFATSKIYYQQDFDFQLYLSDANLKKFWAASVEVSCDPSKTKNAKKVGTKLLTYFKRNKYIK